MPPDHEPGSAARGAPRGNACDRAALEGGGNERGAVYPMASHRHLKRSGAGDWGHRPHPRGGLGAHRAKTKKAGIETPASRLSQAKKEGCEPREPNGANLHREPEKILCR